MKQSFQLPLRAAFEQDWRVWLSDGYHLWRKKQSDVKNNKHKNSKSERREVLKLYDSQKPSFWLEIPALSPAHPQTLWLIVLYLQLEDKKWRVFSLIRCLQKLWMVSETWDRVRDWFCFRLSFLHLLFKGYSLFPTNCLWHGVGKLICQTFSIVV